MVEPPAPGGAPYGRSGPVRMVVGADLGTKSAVVLVDEARTVVHRVWVEPAAKTFGDLTAAFETFASGHSISRRGGFPNSFGVLVAARSGEARALGVLKEAGHAIGRAVAVLIPVVDPDVVLQGGQLGPRRRWHLLPAVHGTLARELPLAKVRTVPVLDLGRLGRVAGAIGAAELALDRFTDERKGTNSVLGSLDRAP